MSDFAKMNAPAKINLFLDVLGIRNDGYHDISSIMHSVTLFDEISVNVTRLNTNDNVISVECSDTSLLCDESNLAYKAAANYFNFVGAESVCIEIFIQKNIPVSSGLAGGSTDAASVLILLNRLYNDTLSVAELCEIGEKIGADVPFCIHSGISGGAMIARGIGEKLSVCPPLPHDTVILICVLDIQISTVWAYGEIDRIRENSIDFAKNDISAEMFAESLNKGNLEDIAPLMYNSFEIPVISHHLVINDVKRILLGSGAAGALMSGSGAAIFGLFSSESQAASAANLLKKEIFEIRTFICSPYIGTPLNG